MMKSPCLLHQVTGDPQRQEWRWCIFRVFEKLPKGKVKSGSYTNVDSVLLVSTSRQSSPCVPSFLFANLSTLLFSVFIQLAWVLSYTCQGLKVCCQS